MSLFGRLYRVLTFGQSHSACNQFQTVDVGCVIQGFPSNFKVDVQLIQKQLNRRKPGQSKITTPREEKDLVECVSGLENSYTLGSPICFRVPNQNIKKSDYAEIKNIPRPGHADFTYLKKYGVKAESGGGRSSARQTIGRVIAGALAKQFLQSKGIQFASYVRQISSVSIPQDINNKFIENRIKNQQIQKLGQIIQLRNGKLYQNKINQQQFIKQSDIKQIANLRCPHFQSAVKMYEKIKEAKQKSDSIGGVVQGCVYGLPVGLGQPCFDKLPALMAHAMLSIPATKGFQYGSGFKCAQMTGSQHNDKFDQQLRLKTNFSGGALGGISSGSTFYFSLAFKPASSINFPQQTHSFDGKPVTLQTKGRHDPCVLPRAPPIVDNMAALVIMDLWLINNSSKQH